MKKLICMLLTLLCACTALADPVELPLLGQWAPFFAYGSGEDVCISTWCPLPEGVDAADCFFVADGYNAEWVHQFTAVLPCGTAEAITRAELLTFLEAQVGRSEEALLAEGYTFEAEQYLLFRHAPVCAIGDAGNVTWLNVLIYAAPEGFDADLPFRMMTYTLSYSADGLTISGRMRNESDAACCAEAVTGALLIDMEGRAIFAEAVGRTPAVGIEPGQYTPVTFTAPADPDFALMTVIPVCSIARDGLARRESLGAPETGFAFGKSGELCFRYSLPYVEGTDPADYYISCLAVSVEGDVLAHHWFMPGEGELVDGRVEFPLVPAYVGADAMVNYNSCYRIVRESEKTE